MGWAFRQQLDKLSGTLQDALKSLVDGLELKKPDKKYEPDSRGLVARGMNDKEMLEHFEGTIFFNIFAT